METSRFLPWEKKTKSRESQQKDTCGERERKEWPMGSFSKGTQRAVR